MITTVYGQPVKNPGQTGYPCDGNSWADPCLEILDKELISESFKPDFSVYTVTQSLVQSPQWLTQCATNVAKTDNLVRQPAQEIAA